MMALYYYLNAELDPGNTKHDSIRIGDPWPRNTSHQLIAYAKIIANEEEGMFTHIARCCACSDGTNIHIFSHPENISKIMELWDKTFGAKLISGFHPFKLT